MTKIKVDTPSINEIASNIAANTQSISKPSIAKDSNSTIGGARKAEDVIDELNTLVADVQQAGNALAAALHNAAAAFEATDDATGR